MIIERKLIKKDYY